MPESQGYILPEPFWDLRILVQDLQVERVLRVQGDMHIGGIMLRLVEDLEVTADWSDHALWWPKSNCWLSLTRSTLNHYGVQADSLLIFTTRHKPLRVQLPDLRFIDANVDFSIKCATAVRQLCKELGLRHGEEVSFKRPLSQDHLRRNHQSLGVTPAQRPFASTQQQTLSTTNTLNNNNNNSYNINNTLNSTTLNQNNTIDIYGRQTKSNTNTLNSKHMQYSPYRKLNGTLDTRSHSPDISSTLSRHASYRGFTSTYSSAMLAEDLKSLEISNSPHSPSNEAKSLLLYPKSLLEKARMNAGWLDSSLSLYEQNIRDFDTLQLRFKYLEFYDLNPKLDMARINQIYEQAKWSIQTEEIECSEDEMTLFGSLQYQIQQQASNTVLEDLSSTNDDIDAALTELQAQLEGGSSIYDKNAYNNFNNTHNNHHQVNFQPYNSTQNVHQSTTTNQYPPVAFNDSQTINRNMQTSDITNLGTVELCDFIRFMRLRKFTFRSFKKLFFVYRDTTLTAYRNKDDMLREEPAFAMDLQGCDVVSDVNILHGKYGIRLSVAGIDGMTEYELRFDNQQSYCKWLAAFKLASRGKLISDPSFNDEHRNTVELLNLQQPQALTTMPPATNENIQASDYLAPKYTRSKNRVGRSDATRILEAQSNVRNLSATECKLNYIKAWRALPDFGIHMFVVKFIGTNKEEILGIASDRLIRIDPYNGDHLRVWRFASMISWNVNWEIKQMFVQFEDCELSFYVLSADCKVPHEFIGGYTFLSMRSKDTNQTLNEDLFHELTAGRT